MIKSKHNLSELTRKVLEGVTEANRKLVEESAAVGRSLVVSVNGEIKKVPAKELWAQLNEKK